MNRQNGNIARGTAEAGLFILLFLLVFKIFFWWLPEENSNSNSDVSGC